MKRIKKFLMLLPSDTAYDTMDSPVGQLLLLASRQGLHGILWEHEANTEVCRNMLKQYQHNPDQPIIVTAKQQLAEYFQGQRKVFDIPLCLDGTPFQITVWQELTKIPYGQTISYGEQAQRLGDKNKARAVGLANGLNPISIIVPCHRVIGSNGFLTGFGGGLGNKKLLLQLEAKGQLI